jgi:GxxExxY protein
MKKKREEIEQIAEVVVDAMLKVHRALGPGLLESAYQACLAHELRCRGIEVACEVALPVRYGEIEVEVGYRIDMLVAECIIIENKSVQEMHPIFEAKLLTYLKLSDHRLGFLVNWNVTLIKDGIKRIVNRPLRRSAQFLCALGVLAVNPWPTPIGANAGGLSGTSARTQALKSSGFVRSPRSRKERKGNSRLVIRISRSRKCPLLTKPSCSRNSNSRDIDFASS